MYAQLHVMTQKAWWAFKELIQRSAPLPELLNFLHNAPDGSTDLYAGCRVHLKVPRLEHGATSESRNDGLAHQG